MKKLMNLLMIALVTMVMVACDKEEDIIDPQENKKDTVAADTLAIPEDGISIEVIVPKIEGKYLNGSAIWVLDKTTGEEFTYETEEDDQYHLIVRITKEDLTPLFNKNLQIKLTFYYHDNNKYSGKTMYGKDIEIKLTDDVKFTFNNIAELDQIQ